MKLSELTAKLTSLKGKAVRVLAAGALTGAFLAAAAPAAQAQQFAVGVQFGGPRFAAPPPPPRFYGYGYGYNAGYWEHRRFEEERARGAFFHRQEWQHYHHEYAYGRRY